MSTTTTVTRRRPKWQYQQALPTPRILNLPRRSRRRHAKTTTSSSKPSYSNEAAKCKLETLFDRERVFARGGSGGSSSDLVPVVLFGERGCGDDDDDNDERWRVEAEMLRAECNLLRMEKEIAVRKMERNKTNAEKSLVSAVQTLFEVRNRISEGREVSKVLDEEIGRLAGELEKLQRRSRIKDSEIKNCSNFDKKASLLQRRLGVIGGTSDENCVREIQEMAEASLSISTCEVEKSTISNRKCNMEVLRRKMEGFSKGRLLKRMEEEYKSMSCSANSSAASSVSTFKRYPNSSSSLIQQINEEIMSNGKSMCSGQCKAVVRRIIDQVRVETEQWSQMQVMLRQVRDEMEELQASRDYWEDQARRCDCEIQLLSSVVEEWRHKANSAKDKYDELEAQLSMLQKECEMLKREKNSVNTRNNKCSHHVSHNSQNEMEKRVLVCHLKENAGGYGIMHRQALAGGKIKARVCSNRQEAQKRSPFSDIKNVSSIVRQNSRGISTTHKC